jgi:5-(carboxyamino)imidazole ribonucleotide synthase
MKDSKSVVLPGATIGMVGGGQLGRMFAMAAATMGYDVVVFCEAADLPAAQVAHHTVVGSLDDPAAVDQFAKQCDVITLEFENIPAETIARCAQFAPTYPAASVLATAQDRLLEKSTLSEAGLPVTPYAEVRDAQSLATASESLGWPMIVKTARSGYDGKGQYRVASLADADDVPWESFDAWIAEQYVDFELEVSVIVARTPDGRSQTFPVLENSHSNHILDISYAPASVSQELAGEACQVAVRAAETLGVVGLMCVEFFVSAGKVMINEVAPRPHNSGHLTIEACHTSQFEQHVRAICNLPLGSTLMRCPSAAMANVLGDLWAADGSPPPWEQALCDSSVSLHLYGKRTAKAGRKMGHLTVTGADGDKVRERVADAREKLHRAVR